MPASPTPSVHPQNVPVWGNRDLNRPSFPQSGKQLDKASAAGEVCLKSSFLCGTRGEAGWAARLLTGVSVINNSGSPRPHPQGLPCRAAALEPADLVGFESGEAHVVGAAPAVGGGAG